MAAILEADDDEELLEKMMRSTVGDESVGPCIDIDLVSYSHWLRERQAYLQDVIYKLSQVGQAIENNYLATASSVLGKSTETKWIQKAIAAFNKVKLASPSLILM
ncbi:Thylakoid lumenal 16.5 kDa protein, chloroplastic-like protein [Drosera capensis]